MIRLFVHIFNMSMAAGWVVLAILLLRLVLRKAPKWIFVLLWSAVALRLLVPVFAQSSASLVPSTQTISPQIMEQSVPQIHIGISTMNSAINPVIGQAQIAVSPEKSVNVVHVIAPILTGVWVVGCCGLLGYCLVSFLRIRKRVATAVVLESGVYESDRIDDPFLLGLWKPRIYLPFGLDPRERQYIIAHEKAHIRRKDHLWKPLGYLLLTVYWFHPLLWLAYWLLCRDIELACDEKVAHTMDPSQRADYSQTLLNHTVKRSMISACPLAFGQGSVKRRVKSVLNYKKPTFWVLLVAVIAGIVVTVCFLTDPMDKNKTVAQAEATEPEESLPPIEVYDSSTGGWTFDIDGDGVDEVCSLDYDLSSSAFCVFSISVRENGKLEYYNQFSSPTDKISFANTNRGVMLCLDTDTEYWDYYYTISAQGATIVLTPCEENAPVLHSQVSHYEIPAVNIENLKRRYPQYFDLPTKEGLSVYIWQMAQDAYSCVLLPGKTAVYTQADLFDYHRSATTIVEMRAIVGTYDLDRSMVSIKPIQMWHSSYGYTIDDAYTESLENLFWEGNFAPTLSYGPIIDSASFDIDDDGIAEWCTIGYGPTSGLFTIVLSASENGTLEYYNIFDGHHGLPHFMESNGKMQLWLALNAQVSRQLMYDISVEDGNIVLMPFGGQTPSWNYWGPQGAGAEMYWNVVRDENGEIIYAESHPEQNP